MDNTKVKSLKTLVSKLFGLTAKGDTICEVLDSVETPKEILIKSSTSDSVKVFKITVVDDGTLTATEVTE